MYCMRFVEWNCVEWQFFLWCLICVSLHVDSVRVHLCTPALYVPSEGDSLLMFHVAWFVTFCLFCGLEWDTTTAQFVVMINEKMIWEQRPKTNKASVISVMLIKSVQIVIPNNNNNNNNNNNSNSNQFFQIISISTHFTFTTICYHHSSSSSNNRLCNYLFSNFTEFGFFSL